MCARLSRSLELPEKVGRRQRALSVRGSVLRYRSHERGKRVGKGVPVEAKLRCRRLKDRLSAGWVWGVGESSEIGRQESDPLELVFVSLPAVRHGTVCGLR